MDAVVEVRGVTFGYGSEPILRRVDLAIRPGEFLGLIGPNGGGKTTLLKVILGLLKPSAGEVRLFGRPLSGFSEWFKVGYVPQKPMYLDTRFPVTVKEVVSLGRVARAGLWRRLGAEDDQAVSKALDIVEMGQAKDRLITSLSGGQQQRVSIARALASEPELLILDEPTTGVDVASQDRFFELLAKLKGRGLSVLMASHEIALLAGEVTRLACVNAEIVYDGDPKEFMREENVKKIYGKSGRFFG
jgi:zinc transport system ATP-binding protein